MNARRVSVLYLDISMFKNSLISKLENRIQYSGGGCSKDSDCNFNFRCLGECDMESLKCTTRLKSNNLMVRSMPNYITLYD